MMSIGRDAGFPELIVALSVAAFLSQLAGMSTAIADTLRRSGSGGVFTPYAHECPSASESPYRLCVPGQPISRQVAKMMSERLNGVLDKTMLCAVDSVVIRSQFTCQADDPAAAAIDPFNRLLPPDLDDSRDADNDLLLAELMTDLAKSWGRHGDAERAEQLFQGADSLAAFHEDYIPLARRPVLKEWLAFEISRGELERALSVAQTLSASHRHMLGQWAHWPTIDLAEALKIEADLLDRLGRRDEAEERRREADSLTAVPQ